VFLVARCGSTNETGEKEKKTTEAVKVQKESVRAKYQKIKYILPKPVLAVELTDEQIIAAEAAYDEIFTPEVLAKRKELLDEIKAQEKDSEEYKKLHGKYDETFRPYYADFYKRVWRLLTKEQQEICEKAKK
jgi:hypothetical protein